MTATTAMRGILRADMTRLLRDRFLLAMIVYLVGMTLALRWALPWISGELGSRWGFDLRPWYPLLVCHVTVVLASVLTGILGGFQLLECREDGTVKALMVVPVPLPSYLVLVSGFLVAVGTVLAVAEAAIIGVGLPSWPALIAASAAGATAGPMNALFLASTAANKVEAMAVGKFVGSFALIPFGVYFLAEPWQWLAVVYPPYWAAKSYWVAAEGGAFWPLWALGAPLASALWSVPLGHAFLRAARA